MDTWLARPPKNNELTEFQIFALERMPVGEWFDPFDLDYMVRRPEATCEMLYVKGYLEKSAKKDIPRLIYKLAIDEKELVPETQVVK